MSGGNPLKAGHPEPVSCSVDHCQRIAGTGGGANGWCGAHYKKVLRYGTPHGGRSRRLPEKEVARLRHLLGIPVEGPSQGQKRAWTIRERELWEEFENVS